MSFEAISARVSDLMWARWKDHDRDLLRDVLVRLTAGRPVPIEELERSPILTRERVQTGLNSGRYALDDDDHVVEAFGISLLHDYPFQLRGAHSQVRTCCGLVAMVAAQLSPGPVEIRTRDPVTDGVVSVEAAGYAVPNDPDGRVRALLVAPDEAAFLADIWNAFCRFIRYYETPASLHEAGDPPWPSAVASLAQMAELAARVGDRLWGGRVG